MLIKKKSVIKNNKQLQKNFEEFQFINELYDVEQNSKTKKIINKIIYFIVFFILIFKY